MIPTGSKAVINQLKKAKQNGFLQLMNLELEEFPKEVVNFNTMDFQDQNWWSDIPLQKIDLTNNKIKFIPPQLFENENQITVIKMINNQLTQLPIEMFNLKSLKSIDFSKNKLKSIPYECTNSQSLIEIILQENQIQQMPQQFNNMHMLQSINLSNNQIEEFPVFSNLKQLIKIDLSINKIKIVNNQVLFNCISLQQLNLQKNQISQLQQGAFQSLNSLVTLQLDQNKLQEFNEIPVSQVLDSITLSFNQLQQIQGFSNIPNLTILVLNNNKLKHLDKSILILKNIKTLDLSNNDLVDIPNELGILPQLVRINIEGNPLKSIRNNIKNGGADVLKKYLKSRITEDVNELEKAMNPKAHINQSVDFWEQVIRDFYQNGEFICRQKELKDIGTKIFMNLPNIRVLDLQINQIYEIPREIYNIRNTLVKLNLNDNKLQTLPQEILALEKLVELELQQNQLESFFDQYKINFPNLKLLNLSLNKFQQVPECVIQFYNLNVINLAYNQIQDIEVLFNSQLQNLEVIDVCNNKIESISDQIAYTLGSIQHLNLENNNMQKISSILGFLPLRSLKIDGNPLKQIPRQVISKGNLGILDYLKNKHPTQNPQGLAFQQKRQQQFIQQRQEEELANQETNIIQMQQYIPPPQQQIVQTVIQQKSLRDPQQVQLEIDQLTIQIKQIEQQLSDNYSLNKFVQNQMKKDMQAMMMKRSSLLNELKN